MQLGRSRRSARDDSGHPPSQPALFDPPVEETASAARRGTRAPAPLSPGSTVPRSSRTAPPERLPGLLADRTDVEVRRSARRRRTVQAVRRDGKIIVMVPASMSAAEEARWVRTMVARLEASSARRRPHDADLERRAAELSQRFLDGRARPVSVRWSDRQQRRWGSCTPADGTIRLSRRLEGMPTWVVDYVLVHELVHLLVPDHSRRFWAYVERYPMTERAKGFLLGVASVDEDAPTDED